MLTSLGLTRRLLCAADSAVIDGEPLRFRGELYHPYHFNCKACGIELDSRAREVKSRAGYTSVELVRDWTGTAGYGWKGHCQRKGKRRGNSWFLN